MDFNLFNCNALGYLDPGTGSWVVQTLIAGAAGAAFAIRMFWHRIVTVCGRVLRRGRPRADDTHSKEWIIHPLCFALFPVLALYSHNVRSVDPLQMAAPSGLILAAALPFWGLLQKGTGDRHKAALLTSLVIFFFFSYGPVFEILHRWLHPERAGWIDVFLLPGWAAILGIVAATLFKTRGELWRLTRIANVVGVCLLSLCLAKTGWYIVNHSESGTPLPPTAAAQSPDQVFPDNPHTAKPDIYFIILDAYARDDILRNLYDYDNTPFLDALRQRGFFIARKSQAQYSQTCLSLGSTLNLQHLDGLAERVGSESNDVRPLMRMLQKNRAMQYLRDRGYTTHTFATGYRPTEFRSADYYHSPAFVLDDFQSEIFNSTPIPVLQQFLKIPSGRRRMTLYTFEQLRELPAQKSPKFVFAHILAPHGPFIFGPSGEIRVPTGRDRHTAGFDEKERYVTAYRDQLIFVNRQILDTVDAILSQSSEPPVIILQSDHGPASQLDWDNPTPKALQERMANLNALCLPGFDRDQLELDLSPINTFALVFNHYFGADFGLQENKSRFSSKVTPYRFSPPVSP